MTTHPLILSKPFVYVILNVHTYMTRSFTVSPVRGTDAEAPHLARQRPVSVAAAVKSRRIVVLSVPGSVSVSVAMTVVGSGVSVIQVSGLGRLGGLWRLGLGGVGRFTAVTAISAGDGTEILKRKKGAKKGCIKKTGRNKRQHNRTGKSQILWLNIRETEMRR